MLGYELVAEINVTSATTQVDFTGLSFTNDDVLLLVSDIINPNASNTNYYLYANSLTSTYYNQRLSADSTTVNGARTSSAIMAYCEASDDTLCNAHIKLNESGYFTWIANSTREYGQSGISLDDYYGTKTATISSITSLNIVSSVASGIGIGSRFKLYKLIAEPIADVTVSSDTTSVDITGLSLDETNELLLISDIYNASGSTSNYNLYVNADTTSTNYYCQSVSADGSTRTGSRVNSPYFGSLSTTYELFSDCKIKLTNNGNFTYYSNVTNKVGTSSILQNNYYGSKLSTITSITQLTIASTITNAIATSSRFKLYKLK